MRARRGRRTTKNGCLGMGHDDVVQEGQAMFDSNAMLKGLEMFGKGSREG